MLATIEDLELLKDLNKKPEIKNRIRSILSITNNSQNDCHTANDAEQKTIAELRKLGNEVLHSWGKNRAEEAVNELLKNEKNIEKKGKKKITWHSTYGDISVLESEFGKVGKRFRPFSTSAEIYGRCCSLPLQRAIVDFGSDNAFGKVPSKLGEHYGIKFPKSTIQALTESHATKMTPLVSQKQKPNVEPGCKTQIGQIDGSMIPIVMHNDEAEDKRKNKKLVWKEARLTLAHDAKNREPKFGTVFLGNVNDVGDSLHNSAILAGFGKDTHLHAVGDGAPWIAMQVKDKFGSQSSYLIDFYHVCEYLSEAAKSCAPKQEKVWVEQQKARLKNNEYHDVIDTLAVHVEPEEIEDDKAPVRACHRYLSNRKDKLDYKNAIENGLPIGSGEVESSHRYVIQERLKLSGAWWKEKNADSMLALRVMRANGNWDSYWNDLQGQAA